MLSVVGCVVVCVVVVLKEEREGQGERFQAMTCTGGASMLWTALHLCAEPMSEAAENPSPVSSGVLVTVRLYVYSNKGYSVFGKLYESADGDNLEFCWAHCLRPKMYYILWYLFTAREWARARCTMAGARRHCWAC